MSLEDFMQQYYFPLKESDALKERFYYEHLERERNPFQRDYSRILYSSSFRRLQGKMQLLGIQEESFHRNRLTHSLEVAQVARGIAERLRDNVGWKDKDIYTTDMYVIEAAALAHDIGNPPFGHHGESVLDELTKTIGGFEGNAQTLRVLNRIEEKLPDQNGLNLTKRTLLSVVKYNKRTSGDSKKFVYDEDYEWINKLMNEEKVKPRTLDVQIIDLADEIAYAAHDLEDALSLKLFTIDEFLYEFSANVKSLDGGEKDCEIFTSLVENSRRFAQKASKYKSSEEYAFLFRKDLISNIVNTLINDIGVVKVEDELRDETATQNEFELNFIHYKYLADLLKKVTFKNITRSNKVQMYESMGEKVIRGLYAAYTDTSFNKNKMLLPVEYRSDDDERSVADYIAGMMDTYAIQQYKEIYGKDSLENLYSKSL